MNSSHFRSRFVLVIKIALFESGQLRVESEDLVGLRYLNRAARSRIDWLYEADRPDFEGLLAWRGQGKTTLHKVSEFSLSLPSHWSVWQINPAQLAFGRTLK